MTIDDIEIKIKKYDRDKNQVIINLTFLGQLEVRGYVLRYTATKYSHGSPVWVVTPPCVRSRKNTYFHIVRVTDTALWQQIQERMVNDAKEYTNSL